MIPEHLKKSLHHLRKIDPKLDAFFRHPQKLTTPDNIQTQHNHDLGLYDEPVVQKGPSWMQLAHEDIQHYFGRHPIEE